MLNETLNQLCQHEWESAREYLLNPRHELHLQITLVPADEEKPFLMTVVPEPPVPPYDIVRWLLCKFPAQAFVMVSEAWHVKVPTAITSAGMDAVRAWRRTLPNNLVELPPELRGESLSLMAVGRDFTLQRCCNFTRRKGVVIFDPENQDGTGGRPLESRFFGLRPLLVAPLVKECPDGH